MKGLKDRKGWLLVFWSLATLAAVSLVVVFSARLEAKICNHIEVQVEQPYDTYFVSEEEVIQLMTAKGTEKVIGAEFESLSLKKLENRIKSHKFVHSAVAYRDFQGNLFVRVGQKRPIARIVRPQAPDAYISESGEILPTSERFTARVMLLSGAYADRLVKQNLTETPEGTQLLELLRFIDADPYWKAQLPQLEIDRAGYIRFYPQLTKQLVEFGKPEQLKEKFSKLKLFYQKILPARGWNTYRRVNLMYKDQIVCE
jgi:cell division protein FtsQ